MTPKKLDTLSNQSDRFIEAAKKAGVDGSGKKFERAMAEVLKSQESETRTARPKKK
jgi:hypothetical protein